MTIADTINRIYREFRRYSGDGLPGEPTGAPLPIGDPKSGPYSPKKSELRAAFMQLLAEPADNAAAAEAALAEIERLYLGAKTVDPTTDNQGGVLETGTLYFNTTDGKFRVWTSAHTWQNQSTALSDNDVTTAKIAAGAVTAVKIATGAVTEVKIADGSVSMAKLGGDALSAISAMSGVEFMVSQLALQVADNTNVALFLGPSGNRVFDAFDALTFVDVAGATNLAPGSAGVLKATSAVGAEQIPTMTGATTSGVTMSATSTFGAGNEAWRAGDKNTAGSGGLNVWLSANGVDANLNVDLGSAKTIVNYKVTNGAYQNGPTTGWSFQGANAADYSDAVTLDSQTGATFTEAQTRSYPVSTPGAYRYYRWVTTQRGGTYSGFYEVGVQIIGAANNLTVRSAVFTAAAVPTKMKGLLSLMEVDAATADTDYTLEFSRDAGTTWTVASLTELYTMPTTGIRMVETNEVNVSAQPIGTSPRWRFKTANNKRVELNAVGIYWS